MSDNTTQEALLHAFHAGELAQARVLLEKLHPAQVADLLEGQTPKDREGLWALIGPGLEGDILAEVQDEVRAGLLERIPPAELAEVTRELETDDAADILQDLPEDVAESVLLSMDAQNRERLALALSYPEDTAGGLMNTDVVCVRADVSLDVLARYLRKLGAIPRQTSNLMVVDRDNHYLGALSLADALTSRPQSMVGEHMQKAVGIQAGASAHEVARVFEQRDLLSAAVIDEQGRLLRQITVDDVVDVIQGEAEQTVRSMAGLGEEDMFAPVLISSKRRAVWLGINLLTALLASWVIGRFEAAIESLVALAILMPIVASMGGIAGGQTLTIAIRGLALDQITPANTRSLLVKECAVGVLNGLIWAAVVAALATLWFQSAALGLIIGLAMMVNLIIAALAGGLIPLSLKRLGVDPAIAGGVLLTTVTDVVGFMTFLGLATVFLLP